MSHDSHGAESRTLTELINYLQDQASFSTFQNLGACSLDIATVLTFEGSAWTDVKIHAGTTQLGQPQERPPRSCGLEVRWGLSLQARSCCLSCPDSPSPSSARIFPVFWHYHAWGAWGLSLLKGAADMGQDLQLRMQIHGLF